MQPHLFHRVIAINLNTRWSSAWLKHCADRSLVFISMPVPVAGPVTEIHPLPVQRIRKALGPAGSFDNACCGHGDFDSALRWQSVATNPITTRRSNQSD